MSGLAIGEPGGVLLTVGGAAVLLLVLGTVGSRRTRPIG
ncbi:putative membrane protein [Saccharothrix espanaensis DSM 44229]|uniref:Putative membrane protein n=1 Tax=Saccharothrix espanaensis (strain ATCC 51144 / DSM 44229 / JCM 9112 / NBRC 15066 / NRRL 15764) TaxID=1179773 RepID=K0JQX9_SACES|nr:putative membrane protein [Saccharothrix espanaensis DSM 44229]